MIDIDVAYLVDLHQKLDVDTQLKYLQVLCFLFSIELNTNVSIIISEQS